MEPKIAVYLRVSTDGQNHQSQEAELTEYCERRGWKNVRWFRDTVSGAEQNRLGLNELMALVRRGRIDIVLTVKLDRVARSLSHLAQILAELQAHNVALVCPSQGIDTSNANPAARLQLNILAAVAQFERELITERVNSGLAAAKQRGVKLGRPSKKAKYVEEVKALRRQGLRAREISEKLNLRYSSVTEMIRETTVQ